MSEDKIDLILKIVENCEKAEKDNKKEIDSLRLDRHEAIRGIRELDLKSSQMTNDFTMLCKDNNELKKVVKANTDVMQSLQKTFDEANIVMLTIVRGGRLFAWLIAIIIAILTVLKLLGYIDA